MAATHDKSHCIAKLVDGQTDTAKFLAETIENFGDREARRCSVLVWKLVRRASERMRP